MSGLISSDCHLVRGAPRISETKAQSCLEEETELKDS